MSVPGVTLRGDGARSPSSPQGRVSLAKVHKLIAQRLNVCRDAADRYSDLAQAQRRKSERDFYLRMSATERCAASELRYVLGLLGGEHLAARATGPASPQGNSGNTPDQDQRP